MAKQVTGTARRRPSSGSRPAGRRARPVDKARKARRLLWGGILLVGLIAVSLPTVMLVGIGMLPTFVAWICDRTEEKFATFCVGGLNFSGVFPYLMDLWTRHHSVGAASATLTNVFSLAVMFGSAALGWMLFAAVPPVIATFLNVLSDHRLTILRTQQRKLVEEWGEEVRGEVEMAAPPPPRGAAAPAAPSTAPAAAPGQAAA